jgi:hypothetical protein
MTSEIKEEDEFNSSVTSQNISISDYSEVQLDIDELQKLERELESEINKDSQSIQDIILNKRGKEAALVISTQRLSTLNLVQN